MKSSDCDVIVIIIVSEEILHIFRSPSYDRSTVSSKASSPHSAISAYASIHSILLSPWGRPIAAYVFFLAFMSLPSYILPFLQQSVLEGSSYARLYQSS